MVKSSTFAAQPLRCGPVWANPPDAGDIVAAMVSLFWLILGHVNRKSVRRGSRAHKISNRIEIYQALCRYRMPFFCARELFTRSPSSRAPKRPKTHISTPYLAGTIPQTHIRWRCTCARSRTKTANGHPTAGIDHALGVPTRCRLPNSRFVWLVDTAWR